MFFFFNFSNKLDENPFVKKAFELVCINKLESEGYCDMNPFFDNPTIRKDILAWELRKINSKLALLYNHRYPNDMDECEKLLLPIFDKMSLNIKNEDNIELNHLEAVAIVNLIYKSLGKPEERVEYTQKMVRQTDVNVRLQSGFIYMYDYIDLNFVGNVSEFIKLIDSCKSESEDKKKFYRGHSDANYLLNPSIYRNEEWLVNERKMYLELISNCANDFKNMKNHLDYLVEMQHYGLPTRLLDITQNPLVALYFACESSDKIYGEVIILAVNKEQIKYSQSDTVTVLASLPLFSFEDQKNFLELSLDTSKNQEEFNNGIKRLLHEIKTEKPAFMNIVEKDDIRKSIVVVPIKSNARIINQDGAFVLCGLYEAVYSKKIAFYENHIKDNIDTLRTINRIGKKVICIVYNKDKIIKELDSFSINKAKIYPEIDDVADYIKNHVKDL